MLSCHRNINSNDVFGNTTLSLPLYPESMCASGTVYRFMSESAEQGDSRVFQTLDKCISTDISHM